MFILKALNIGNYKKGKGVCNYKWQACNNNRIIDTGIVIGHKRSDGWEALVEKIADQAHNAKMAPEELEILYDNKV